MARSETAVVARGTLILLALLAAGAPGALAQEEEEASADLPEEETEDLSDEFALLEEETVVESAARHRQDIGMSPSAITVITREDIDASGATTLVDLLRLVPGMDIILSSRLLTSAGERLFWTNENNVLLVLIDGWEANNELLGQPPWQILTIGLEDIERIEVIRGPASSLYGANAVAGVVSITTRPVPEKSAAWAGITTGEYGTLLAAARGSLRLGDWGFSLGGGADLAAPFSNRGVIGRRVLKGRAVAERRLSKSGRLLFEGGIATGEGVGGTLVGQVKSNFTLGILRAAYESQDLQGQLYWYQLPTNGGIEGPLIYQGIRMAIFDPAVLDVHTFGGEVQWTVPRFWEPLRLIVGGGGRASWVRSDSLLDESYADRTSPKFHVPGVSYWEGRGGFFLHTELAPLDWLTLTASGRLDVNSVTGAFVSPRLATTFKPAAGQFFRLSVARAFRKPAFLESGLHVLGEIPADSPFYGSEQEFFEFMTRIIGNRDLDNEKVLAVEAGYLGRFFDGALTVSLDLYFNQYSDIIEMDQNLVPDPIRVIDLDRTSFQFENTGKSLDIAGGELGVRWAVGRNLVLQGAWAYRQVYDHDTGRAKDTSPKNMFTLGGRFTTDGGLVGSLFGFTRSEFWDRSVENPAGLLAPALQVHMQNVLLLLGRLGQRLMLGEGVLLEAGVKLFLPLPRAWDKGGSWTDTGASFGGDLLGRSVLGYLQGSY